MKRLCLPLLLLMLCLLPPPAGAEMVVSPLTEKTPGRQSAARYTPVTAQGVPQTLYAFTDASGRTQYRVYGQIGSQTGYFEAQLLAPANEGGDYMLSIPGSQPVRDRSTQFAHYRAPERQADTAVPAGFSLGRGGGLVRLLNYFGRSEYLAYATLDQQTWRYYHTDGRSRAKPGGLAVMPESLLERAGSAQRYRLPAIYSQAVHLPARYLALTSDGQAVQLSGALTALPEHQLVSYDRPDPAPTRRPDDQLPLRQGSRGALVRAAQVRLAALNYPTGAADSIYGRLTAAAVSLFQKINGLKETGVLDRQSHERLMASGAKANPLPPPGATPAPGATPPPASYEGSYRARVYTSGGDLNLWRVPNPGKAARHSIARIPFGTVLTGVAKGDNDFSRLTYQGKEGYVDTGYLLFDPIDTATYEGAYNARVRTTGGELPLWEVPNPRRLSIYALLKIPNGTDLARVEKGDQGFSRVTYKDKTGYLSNKYLDFTVPQP